MYYTENNVNLLKDEDYQTPKKADVYLNPKMSVNRELVLEVLRVYCSISANTVECLDAFSATGLCALQWKKNLPCNTNVFAIDLKDECIEKIKDNCKLNNINVVYKPLSCLKEESIDPNNEIHLFKANANVVMHLKSFDFIHLDPFGSTVPYLDAAFKNIHNNGILVLTSTDIASLLTRNPNTVLRNYGAKVIKTEYVKELAVRTVIAGAARSAAKCNKGFNVLLSVTNRNFIFIALQIKRGSNFANESLLKVSELLHCRICEERVWYPSDKLAPIVDPYENLLSCVCHKTNLGKTGVKIGPFWTGDIYDYEFVDKIVNSKHFDFQSKEFQVIMRMVYEEIISFKIPSGDCDESNRNSSVVQIPRFDIPSFYYFTKNMNVGNRWPKFDKILSFVRSQGFQVSRTHFDLTAIKTNANLNQMKEIISKMINNK